MNVQQHTFFEFADFGVLVLLVCDAVLTFVQHLVATVAVLTIVVLVDLGALARNDFGTLDPVVTVEMQTFVVIVDLG